MPNVTGSETGAVLVWDKLKERANALGITPRVESGKFVIKDVPNSHGAIAHQHLDELEIFIRGYELGFESSLEKESALLAKIGELELKLSDVVLSKDECVEVESIGVAKE